MPPSKSASNATPRAFTPRRERTWIKEFTGVSAPYEAPEKPELELRTRQNSTAAESVAKIMDYFNVQGDEIGLDLASLSPAKTGRRFLAPFYAFYSSCI